MERIGIHENFFNLGGTAMSFVNTASTPGSSRSVFDALGDHASARIRRLEQGKKILEQRLLQTSYAERGNRSDCPLRVRKIMLTSPGVAPRFAGLSKIGLSPIYPWMIHEADPGPDPMND